MGYDNLWQFLRDSVLLFFVTWAVSYVLLRVARINRILYLVVHPIVSYIFGNMIIFLFFVIGWVVSLNIVNNPHPVFWELGRLMGWIVGALVVARVYLIQEENRDYGAWLYFLAIASGISMYIAGPFGLIREPIPNISWIPFSPITLMYLGYLGIKIRIRYLQKRKINHWREEGIKK